MFLSVLFLHRFFSFLYFFQFIFFALSKIQLFVDITKLSQGCAKSVRNEYEKLYASNIINSVCLPTKSAFRGFYLDSNIGK